MTSPPESAHQYLDQALQREAARQASLEQRLVAIMSTYTAAVAAAIALAAIITPDTPVSEGLPQALLIVGGVLTIIGLAACIFGLVPRELVDPPDENLLALPGLAADEEDGDAALTDLSNALADELVGLRDATAKKAWSLVVASASFAGSLVAFASALIIAL